MNRCSAREFVIRLLLLACAAGPWTALADMPVLPKADVPPDSRPNVLLIVSDDQRPDTIHVLGNPLIRTPALDSLVQQGMTFTQAIAPNPICVPSRAEIMTGCGGFRNRVGVWFEDESRFDSLGRLHAGRRVSHMVRGQMDERRQTYQPRLR